MEDSANEVLHQHEHEHHHHRHHLHAPRPVHAVNKEKEEQEREDDEVELSERASTSAADSAGKDERPSSSPSTDPVGEYVKPPLMRTKMQHHLAGTLRAR